MVIAKKNKVYLYFIHLNLCLGGLDKRKNFELCLDLSHFTLSYLLSFFDKIFSQFIQMQFGVEQGNED